MALTEPPIGRGRRGAATSLLLAALLATAVGAAEAAVRKYDWHVALATGAPDCFERDVILVNGQLSPTLEITQGDTLEVRSLCRCQPACRPACRCVALLLTAQPCLAQHAWLALVGLA